METLFSEKPPWKSPVWIRSPLWTPSPHIEWSAIWIEEKNQTLLSLKESIGDLDKQHKWEIAKKMVNPYELVYTHGDQRLPPALCVFQPLSRSYFKMVEILEVTQFFQDSVARGFSRLRTAHIAEGPGGFIQACLSIGDDKKRPITSATAMTLKPTTPYVPGWRKAAAFLAKNKQVHIHYGVDGTGDIYRLENRASFLEATRPGAHLFTADGGFDFSVDYSQQEQKVFHLLLCSAATGLLSLRPEGYFVLKLFDCNSPHTRALLCFLGRHFELWTLYRPAMTRPCNSERYFLGRGFRGIQPEAKAFLQEMISASAQGRFPVMQEAERETEFLDKNSASIANLQIESIRHAILFSQDPTIWSKTWYARCVERSAAWCEAFRVPYRISAISSNIS